ncbi:MAG TPA: OadG family protein [Anaerolineales bacterium]|nr:OadG family protein [Anaerolineales bacterium]
MDTETILLGLAITGLGMGLVFASIILLWAVMEATMWVVPRLQRTAPAPAKAVEAAEVPEAVVEVKAESDTLASERRRQAALAAVAVALAADKGRIHEFPMPPTAIVSAWQAVMRSSNLSKRGSTR